MPGRQNPPHSDVEQHYFNINGTLVSADEARVPAADRSFRYGYGLFETMLELDGRIRYEAYHWERLESGIRSLQFPIRARFMETLRQQLQRTLAKQAPAAARRIRLQVSAGSGGLFDTDAAAAYIIECWSLPEFSAELNGNGLVLGIADARKEPGPYSACKTSSALCYAMAARQAKAAGWNDALLCNASGNIVESAIANLFVLIDAEILTPPLSEGCVDGVMRRVLIERLNAAGTPAREVPISPDLLQSVEGVILTNAVRGVRWVKSIEGLAFNPDFGRRMSSLLQ